MKDESMKIQMFLNGVPKFYKDKIQYDIPNTLKEVVWKERKLYDLNKNKYPYQKNQKYMKKGKQDQRKKGLYPPTFRNNYQQRQPKQNRPRGKETLDKILISYFECWMCKENHNAGSVHLMETPFTTFKESQWLVMLVEVFQEFMHAWMQYKKIIIIG